MSECRYEIDGVTYFQRPLVFGQIKQLTALLGGIKIDMSHGADGLIQVIGDHMSQVLAIVLNPEGVRVKDKDLAMLADDLEFAITAEQTVQVIDDFFVCNPVVSLLNRLSETSGVIKDLVVNWMTGLISSYVSLPEGILPSVMPSCGATPQPSVSTGLNTEGGKSDSESLLSPCSEAQKSPEENRQPVPAGEISESGSTAAEKI